MMAKKSKRGRAKKASGKKPKKGKAVQREGDGGPPTQGPRRFPAITVLFLGLIVGWFVAHWLGMVLGGVVGFILWRSRA